jgi:hypothetical protein
VGERIFYERVTFVTKESFTKEPLLYLQGNLLPRVVSVNEQRDYTLKELFSVTKHIGMIRYAATTVCIGMHELALPALLTLMIIDELYENDIRMWAKWELITAVKHFHERRR